MNPWPLILDYHDVDTESSNPYSVSPHALERHLAKLLARGFTPLSLAEAVESGPFGTGEAARRTFTITFDDGYASFKELAMPVLERLGLLAATTVFMPTALVGKEEPRAPSDPPGGALHAENVERYMSWEDLKRAVDCGVAIESHGHSHVAMNELSFEAAREDAERSYRELASHGLPARYLAVPFGLRTSETKQAIAEAGFDAAFSVFHGGRDRYEIRRVPIYGSDKPWMIRLKLSGRYFDVYDLLATLAGKKRNR